MEAIEVDEYVFPTRRYNATDAQGYPTIFDPGMSLRAYFAAMAMQGLAPKYIAEKHEGYDSGYFAREAVEIADALLAALKGGAA